MSAKILIVEDEDEIRGVMAEELDEAGYQVVQAANGQEGLVAIRGEKPDLILSDISMPVLDGIGMLETLRKDQPDQAKIPFVFLTAYSDRDRQIAARRNGADEFINKPVDFELLLAVVENQLKKKQDIRENHDAELVKLFRVMQSDGDQPRTSSELDRIRERAQDHSPKQPPKRISNEPQTTALPGKNAALGGRIRLIGLDDIKDKLGSRWDKVAAITRQIAENKIAQNLSSSDTYQSVDNDSFEVCIQSASEAEATSIIQRIKQEIMDAIVTLDENPDVDISKEEAQALRSIRSEFFPVEPLSPEEAQDDDLLDMISARIDRAARNFAENARQMLAQIVQDSDIHPVAVLDSRFKQTPIAICTLDPEAQRSEMRIRNAYSDDARKMLELDTAKLGIAIQYILKNPTGNIDKFVISVDLNSLSVPKFRQQYVSVIGSMPKIARGRVVLLIDNGIGRMHPSILADIIRSLKSFSVSCWLRTSLPAPSNELPHKTLAPVITMNYFDVEANIKNSSDKLRLFKKQLTKNENKLMIDGIKNETHRKNSSHIFSDYYAIEK